MKIAIIGSGKIGGTLAKGLDKAGHHVCLGTRDTAKGEVVHLIQNGQFITANTILEAANQAEVIIVTVPLVAVVATAESLGDLSGKVVIDTTNGFGKQIPDFIYGATALKSITKSTHVVKCFNTIGFESLGDPVFGHSVADMFMAGDSDKAKKIAQHLAYDLGFKNCYDLGGEDSFVTMESIAQLWGALAYKANLGRGIAFKILKK